VLEKPIIMETEVLIKMLKERIGTDNSIQKIPVVIDNKATIDNCFPNVIAKIDKCGGNIIYGWEIIWSSILGEAQRHAIWQSPNGELQDITPREYFIPEIKFIVDNNWKYDRQQVPDNIRINLTNNSAIDDFIIVCETVTKLYQTGERLPDGRFNFVTKIIDIIKVLEKLKVDLETFVMEGNNSDSICFCCNEKTYKNCIGAKVREEMIFILEISYSLLKNIAPASNS
jgi:hypothetical protein